MLTGGIPASVSPTKQPAPALLSPGMLPSLAPPMPPTNIPPPPSQSNPAQMSQGWETPALLAQQQAQMIAQQNLLARQNQNELALITQHNLAVLNQGPLSPGSGNSPILKPTPYVSLGPHVLPPQYPFLFIPNRLPLGVSRPPVAYPNLIQTTPAPGMYPMMQHVAVKRSYGDAFPEQPNSPAKRSFHAQGAVTMPYTTFYPNI